MGSVNLATEAAKKQTDVIEWLNNLFPDFNLPPEASEEELRARLADGSVLYAIVRMTKPGLLEESRGGDYSSPRTRMEYLSSFLLVVDQLGLPTLNLLDLEQGTMAPVIACLHSLLEHTSSSNGDSRFPKSLSKCRSQPVNRSTALGGGSLDNMDVSRGVNTQGLQNSLSLVEERKQNLRELRTRVMRSPLSSAPSSPLSHQVGHKFHEIFQLNQGRYSDLPAAKISEMIKSNSLDSAPTQSLLSIVNGILDESIERKNGEIPQRIACLLRKVVQEIERRISTQAEHIRNQNNLIKSREEKYLSRIRVLETLATGTSEETRIIINQLQLIKAEKDKLEEKKKLRDQDVIRLGKEKESSDHKILELQQALETTKKSYEQQCQLLEAKATVTKVESEERIKELESLLADSRKKTKELEALSESKFQTWNQKQNIFQSFIGSQLQSVQELRASSELIKHEVVSTKMRWSEELTSFGLKMKDLTDAAENYHTVLAENRKLFNEVQELKGNIRVYCRIRPFLYGECKSSTTIDYIGENGELLLTNPSKQGKDVHRTYKFNKVFGPAATQEQVYLDIQPLVRSVLDGYNVCIFAYGQTGSGKTYTMTGPNLSSKEDWGVNYRALHDLFQISRDRKSNIMYEVGVQMVEIYNEQVRDLLANDASQKRLGIWSASQPNGLAVPDASMHQVTSTSDVLELMKVGLANRAVGATALNERSSRSHSVVTIHVRGADKKTGATLRGSLHLVDLAGSERVDRSEVTGDRLKEAQHINKSLSALGDVIFSLSQKSAHVPYRNSKLTQVLQSSLGGQAKTLMLVQINPDAQSYSETSSTLKFAERVSGVELGAAKSNKESKDIRELMEQVASLKDTVARKDEELENLQLLKDLGSQSPGSNSERQGRNSLKHSSSAHQLHGMATPKGRRLSGGKVVISNNKSVSDNGNSSDFSDKHSENSSQNSLDGLKHQKEYLAHPKMAAEYRGLAQPKMAAENRVPPSSTDIELLGFGDADAEERLSDISDGGLSMGGETDGTLELSLFPEHGKTEHSKTAEAKKERMHRVPSKTPKPTSRNVGQPTATRSKLKDTLKTSSLRKSASSQAIRPSAKTAKRWQ